MAKSKRSAALFEVIQSSRLPQQQKPLISRWWFQRRPRKANPFPTAFASQPSEQSPDPEEIVDLPNSFVEPPSVSEAETSIQTIPTEEAPKQTAPKQPIAGVDLQLDPDRQQITFKVSYNSAIVTGFTILVAIGMAYAVGRKMSRGPIAATASPSTAELRAQPAHPEVLDIAHGDSDRQAELTAHLGDKAQLASSKIPAHPNLGSSTPTVDARRIIGRQYVVIQIYPDKKNADDAAALLNKNNIPCTVENGLAGWASKSWWCVVGTTGFDHIRGNADYARYESAVNKVSDEFAVNSKFKKFEPRAYRWKESTT